MIMRSHWAIAREETRTAFRRLTRFRWGRNPYGDPSEVSKDLERIREFCQHVEEDIKRYSDPY